MDVGEAPGEIGQREAVDGGLPARRAEEPAQLVVRGTEDELCDGHRAAAEAADVVTGKTSDSKLPVSPGRATIHPP